MTVVKSLVWGMQMAQQKLFIIPMNMQVGKVSALGLCHPNAFEF